MEHAATMQEMSFRKNPRDGQRRVFEKYINADKLNIKLPTGYGKTFTMCGCYAIKQKQGVNRLLVIFPTDAQLEQFAQDGHNDLYDAGVTGVTQVIDIRFFGINAIKKHSRNEAQVYAITVQSLIGRRGMDIVKELMGKGKWMLAVDEYHHYGLDKIWGKSVVSLPYHSLLAMSATPYRKNEDSAFGLPDVNVTYKKAKDEKAVKPLRSHSYTYIIDAIDKDGDVISYTTGELSEEVKEEFVNANPDNIEKFKIERQMRWSPKYVSPLVTIPIDRMISNRVVSGYKLQAIIKCMCVSHAKMVYEQVKSLYPELVVDWVGTGDNGRSQEENKKVLSKFCPPKDDRGNRNPSIDILVHVGMAGEGLDTITTSEIVFLTNAGVNNTNNQDSGRAARYLEGVIGHINFDSSCGYARESYIGDSIMDAMDNELPTSEEDNEVKEPRDENDIPELPEEPTIQIWDVRLDRIDSGDKGVQMLAPVLEKMGVQGISYKEMLNDLSHPDWESKLIPMFRGMREKEAMQFNEKAITAQWQEQVNNASRAVAGRTLKIISPGRFDKALAGDIKKRLNRKKKQECGAVTEDIQILQKHYTWLQRLEENIISHGVPSWLQ